MVIFKYWQNFTRRSLESPWSGLWILPYSCGNCSLTHSIEGPTSKNAVHTVSLISMVRTDPGSPGTCQYPGALSHGFPEWTFPEYQWVLPATPNSGTEQRCGNSPGICRGRTGKTGNRVWKELKWVQTAQCRPCTTQLQLWLLDTLFLGLILYFWGMINSGDISGYLYFGDLYIYFF